MSRAADDYEGLTTAFLGGSSSGGASSSNPSRGRPASRAQEMPGVLVVANVPTLAGIWIAQYADQLARSVGAVALVRLDGAASRAEIYRAQGRAMPLDGSAWLERASAFARAWIVCVDSRCSSAELVQCGCALTLMSGTDETAIAAARRLIESIVQAASTLGVATPPIGLVFVGSPHEAAQSATDALIAWASERSYGLQLALTAHAPRVDRVESTGAVPLGMLSALDLSAATEFVAMAMSGSQSRFASAPVAPAPVAPAPAPAPAALPQPSSSIVPEFFAHFVALPFNCPDAPLVHLARDDAGALHLIQSGNAANTLRVASAWARANWALIVAACPRLRANPPHIIEHLLLDDARDGALLHRTGVLLHARIEVTVGSSIVRQRIDLNDSTSAGL
ncbi:MAG: hypothetical protein EXS17_04735 [Phycisphaerales bacterium]|nr:hypothetical protein [Phycisphaerales bacterium]